MLGILSLIAGVLALILFWVPIFGIFWSGFFGLAAIILGAIGLVQVGKGKASGKGLAISGLILGVVSIILSIVATVVFWNVIDDSASALGESLESLESFDPGMSSDMDQILAENLDVTMGTFEVTGDPSFPDTNLPVTFTNKGDTEKTFYVTIEAVVNGSVVESDTAFTELIQPGASEEHDMFQFVFDTEAIQGAEFRVSEVSMYDF